MTLSKINQDATEHKVTLEFYDKTETTKGAGSVPGGTNDKYYIMAYLTPVGSKKLADMAKESRQKLISYIPQAPHIFQGTLGENISLFDCGKKEDIAEKINGALKSAGLSLSPDTSIGEGGQGLSNGQLHRLGLARAFYQDKPVVLLDEPTVGLEPAEEKELLNTLDDFSRHRTVIVISHREAVRKWADTEIAIEAGTAVPAGEVRHE